MLKSAKKLVFVGLFLLPFYSATHAQDLKAAIHLTRSEQFTAAEAAFEKLLKQNPNDGDVYYYYGENFIMEYFSDTLNLSWKEIADSASMKFEAGVKADPANPLPLVGLAEIAFLNKNSQKAQSYFARVMPLMPSKANKSLVMSPEKQATVLIRMANAYVMAKVNDTAQIFSLLRSAEKLDPKNYELYIVKGDTYIYLLNDGSNAISNYNIAQSLNPKSPMAKLRVGLLWLRARNYNFALTNYQEVVKIDSMFAPAYRELGSLYARAGRQEEAQKNYKKFLALSAGNTSARKQFVNTLIDLRNYQEAINQLNEILLADTTDNDINRALAYSYFETGQYDKGLYYSRKFLTKAKPEKIRQQDYSYYGRILAKMKMDTLAPEPLLKAYSMDTSKSELLSEAALCWTKAKKYEKAMELYQRKIDMNKGTAMDYYNLGKVYYSVQQFAKADTNLAIFNKMQPDYLQGVMWRARTKSNLDSTDTKGFRVTGYAKPFYEAYLEKTQSDSLKYMKDRFECYDYLAYYYYSQFSRDSKLKEDGQKSMEYYNLLIGIYPNDPKAKNFKEAIDALKMKLK
ncbi:MAG: tetratricopeptide repeat protein [bacterium]